MNKYYSINRNYVEESSSWALQCRRTENKGWRTDLEEDRDSVLAYLYYLD